MQWGIIKCLLHQEYTSEQLEAVRKKPNKRFTG